MRKYISDLFPDIHFDLQKCKSKRNVLKYISKEDDQMFTNIKFGNFSFFYRACKWSDNKENFNFSDPFVAEHKNNYNYLQKIFL